MPGPQRLSLTTTNLRNFVISNPSDVIYYEVRTPEWEPGLTKISRMDPNSRELFVVAEIENVDQRHRAVRLRGEQFRPVEKFVHVSESIAGSGTFRGKDGKRYEWQVKKDHLELIVEGQPGGKALATYHRHRRFLFALRMTRQPYLEIEPLLMETLDTVIVTFILMERKRRDGKKR